MNKSFSNLFKKFTQENNINIGSIIKGTVVAIKKNFVLVDTFLKSESIVSIDQFYDAKGILEISVGDIVDFILDAISDVFGKTILSREKAKRYESWLKLEKSYSTKDSVYGSINGKIKGGFSVSLHGIRAFLPGSLVDIKSIQGNLNLEEKEIEFKVIKIDKKRNNIVVSRKAVVELENLIEKNQILSSLKEGNIINGIVKNLTNYGAFIDLGGIDGLLHITDISWNRIKHPSEVINIADKISVKVLKFDKDKTRVSLGLKQLKDDPWFSVAKRYPKETKLLGKVTNLTDYGCFVEIENGIEGLVHVSEMDWINKNINPSKIVFVGQFINVMVLNIDEKRRRISLGIKQCLSNPWKKFCKKYKIGDCILGIIKSVTDFGIFVNLEEGLSGLVHLSDISWDVSNKNLLNNYRENDKISVVIIQIDSERCRISLGIKQLINKNFNKFILKYKKNDFLIGKIILINKKFIKVYLKKYIFGYLYASYIISKKDFLNTNLFNVGDILKVQIKKFDKKNRFVLLSLENNKNIDHNFYKGSKISKFSSTMLDAFKIAKNSEKKKIIK